MILSFLHPIPGLFHGPNKRFCPVTHWHWSQKYQGVNTQSIPRLTKKHRSTGAAYCTPPDLAGNDKCPGFRIKNVGNPTIASIVNSSIVDEFTQLRLCEFIKASHGLPTRQFDACGPLTDVEMVNSSISHVQEPAMDMETTICSVIVINDSSLLVINEAYSFSDDNVAIYRRCIKWEVNNWSLEHNQFSYFAASMEAYPWTSHKT
jgi:hypothetical protein